MLRKITATLLSIVGFVLVLAVSVYIMLAKYYENGFSFNTWINGVYCTGKSVEEINDELKGRYETRSIEVINPDGNTDYIFPDEIDFRIDFTSYLNIIKEKQNPYLWIRNMAGSVNVSDITPDYYFDEEALRLQIENLTFVKEHTPSSKPYVAIIKTDNGYELFDNHIKTVDRERLYESVKTALYTEDPVIITDEYLSDFDYSDKEKALIVEYEHVKEFLSPKITLDMGAEQILIDSSILSEFIELNEEGFFVRDEEGNLLIDDNKIREYASELVDKYNTADKPRVFMTTAGEEKTIKNVYYGTLIDKNAECNYLVNAVRSGVTETHTPKYIQKGYVRGQDDIGKTYIEVDLTNQVLYFYEDGIVNLCCDIVSGKPGVDLTPAMVCYVYKKQKAAILRGANYASYVDYWMPIYRGIGLHDASWQSAFGGNRFLTHGSHGCINLKNKDAKYIYDHIEVGIPVILYY